MSGLWTVTIQRAQIVSRFDKRGKLIARDITKVPVTFCDLPYATAQMYLAKAPGDTTITQQIRSVEETRRKARERALPEPYGRAINREGVPPKHLGSEDFAHRREICELHEAAAAGDFAAAITAEMEATA